MMSESQALETLSREDPEAAGDARAALAWLTGDEGLETISLLRLQEFLWYALPVKWPMSTPGRVGVAKALGRCFANLDEVFSASVDQLTDCEDVGEVIADIDAGGLKGLRALGYLDGISKPSKEQVTAALRDVYEYLSANLTERQKRLMNFGMLLIEHTLCNWVW